MIHRGDLQQILLNGARRAGVEIRLGARVVRADEGFLGRVQLDTGEWLAADCVIAADGIRSHIRHQMAERHNIQDRSHPTGDAAYRVLIPKEKMAGDKRALELLNSNVGMRWMGPGGSLPYPPIYTHI